MRALLRRISHLGGLCSAFGNLKHSLIAAALGQKPGWRIARLPRVIHTFGDRGTHLGLKVTICEHQIGRFATKLQGHPLDGFCRITGHSRPGTGGPCKRHHLHILVARQGRAHRWAIALDQIEHTGRKARRIYNFSVYHRRDRRMLRGFQNAATARRQGRDDLQGNLVHRPIPRGD